MKKIITVALFIIFINVLNSHALNVGDNITTITITESGGNSASDYPFTSGHPFKKGDVPSGSYVGIKIGSTSYTTQCDIKKTWEDGSIKFAVLSSVIPISASGETNLTLYVTSTGNNAGYMTEVNFLATNIETFINITNIVSNNYTGSLTGDLNASIDSGDFIYWLQGSVCSEIILSDPLNASLEAKYEVRCYPGSSYGIRVTAGVENLWIGYRGDIGYDLEIEAGNPTLSTKYTNTGYTQYHDTRWKKTFWVGTEPFDIDVKYNMHYWTSTELIPRLDPDMVIAPSTITSQANAWAAADTDLNGQGVLTYKYMGSTGMRPELGLLQRWDALALVTGLNSMREICIGSAELAGQIPAHLRESDVTMDGYGSIVRLSDRPNIDYTSNEYMPSAIDTISNNGWAVDASHLPAFAYIAYIMTGDHWFRDEVMFWGNYPIIRENYGRDGACGIVAYDFSNQIGSDSNESGILYDQERGVAWGLRSMSYAAFVSDASDSAYIVDKIQNNIKWLHLANVGELANPLGIPMWIRIDTELGLDGLSYYKFAPWMADFMILSVGMLRGLDILDTTNQTYISDILSNWSNFRVGLYTNDPDYNKFWGTGYVFAAFLASSSMNAPITWAQYKTLNENYGRHGLTIGATSLPPAYISDSQSYLYWAHAALQYCNVNEHYADAVSFVESQWDETVHLLSPQICFAPLGYSPDPTYDAPTITGPSDFSTTASSVEIEGAYTVDPNLTDQSATVTWTLGESSGFAVAALGVFSCTVPVKFGTNSIVFEITDSNSGTDSDTTVVTRTVVPQASITNTSISHGVLRP